MDYISSYKQSLMGEQQTEDQDSNYLDTSMNQSEANVADFDDLFGADIKKKNKNVAKGTKYLLFCVIMVVLLSIQVVLNST